MGGMARKRYSGEDRPDGIYADFTSLAGLMREYGTDLRMPHSRAMGKGSLELSVKDEKTLPRAV